MKLEKITVQGFKSFKRQVSIPFLPGFSAIIGPNGSGKTNILDAVCFVLGKIRSRTMRAKKMQNLIFHGSKKKKGSEYAKVAIYFNNEDKTLPFEDGIVSISRKINQKGVSTYRLNGRIVTRQQILDVFSSSGAYPSGYNIIQQGDVNQIVEMDGIERRKIIDEISGISEYDEKKIKALKELDKVNEKIKEASIILQEKQQVMEKLKMERDTALEYKRLESELEKIRACLVYKEYTSNEKNLTSINEKISAKNKLISEIEDEIKKYDKKVASAQERFEELTKHVMKASKEVEKAKKIVYLRSEVERIQDKIEMSRREIGRIKEHEEQIKLNINPDIKQVLKFNGVYGILADLVSVPEKYRIAVEVSVGSHLKDIVVEKTSTAVKAVKFLKEKRIGRARFLPLDKIKGFSSKFLPAGTIGWLSDLISYDKKYSPAIDYVFGSTACVENIDTAKEILKKARIRMVTLDGDLIEKSGAITGGFYRKRGKVLNQRYAAEKIKIEEDIKNLETALKGMKIELVQLSKEERKTKSFSFAKERIMIDEILKRNREKRKESYEKRLELQQELGRLNIQKARIEAKFDNLKVRREGFEVEKLKPFINQGVKALKENEMQNIERIEVLGPVNLKAPDDYDLLINEFEDFKKKISRIIEEKNAIEDTINEIEKRRSETFTNTMEGIAKNFKQVYADLTGGSAELSLEDGNNIESGLLIKASPPGKKLLYLDSMSGGEKTLTAFAFLFAVQRFKPMPFYILDEADAALDKINTERVVDLIKNYSKNSQFIVISHNDFLIKEADQVYGISMENGESKIFGIKIPGNN